MKITEGAYARANFEIVLINLCSFLGPINLPANIDGDMSNNNAPTYYKFINIGFEIFLDTIKEKKM